MDLENEKVLKLIYPNAVPENLQDNPELFTYLAKLGTYKVEQLKKEQTRLSDESKNLLEQTQDLAISNYKTFIRTAENSRFIFEEFQNAETQVNALIDKLPQFSKKCHEFLQESSQINEKRRYNAITLKKNAQLLEILELPQLMERCIREARYEEALELASYVQKLAENQAHIPVVNSIVHSVQALWHTMLVQLVAQLRSELQLPKCLQIVGFLRRMQAFTSTELRLKFLQARDSWLSASLKAIAMDDAQQHLSRTIEVTRVNLFNIITQYRAIFPEEEHNQLAAGIGTDAKPVLHAICSDGERLFQAWLHEKINDFLKTLQFDLQRDISSFDAVLGQCMYFGLSFSRVGADFRALMVPIFVRVLRQKFENAIDHVSELFSADLEKYTLINKVALLQRKVSTATDKHDTDNLAPPDMLLDFHPLALLCNGYLTALNEIRLCAPIALVNYVTAALQRSLEFVARKILTFYRKEQQAFTSEEQEIFIKLCSCFAYELIPYLQRCIHALFPQQLIINQLGINLLALEKQQLSYLHSNQILLPLAELLPQKIDLLLQQEKLKAQLEVGVTN